MPIFEWAIITHHSHLFNDMNRTIKKIAKYSCYLLFSLIFLIIIAFSIFNYLNPISIPIIQPSTVVLDRENTVLRQFSDHDGIFRHWVELNEINPLYLNTLIQYEDRYFYQHFGINPLASLRAFIQLIKNRKIVSGSSTLTMQVARLLSR